MANKAKASDKSAKSASGAATAKAKSKGKAVKSVETVEAVEAVVTPTDEAVIEAVGDITETPTEATVKVHTCTECGSTDELNAKGEPNFSVLLSGKKRPICKSCQTAKSLDWTTKRADYRKVYARANFLINRGIAVVTPNAKEWTPEYVLMTIKKDENGDIVVDRPAEEVYSEQVAAEKAVREANKASREAIATQAKADRKAKREADKADRDAKRAADALVAKAASDAKKLEKANERAETAKKAKADREAAAAVKKTERDAKALETANKLKADREAKSLEKAETARQNALTKAAEAAAAKKAQVDATNAKALAALRKPVQSATV